jgi:hypothetical protein
LYRFAVAVHGKTYAILARAARREEDEPVILAFSGTLPALPGPFEVRIAIPELAAIPPTILRGRLVPPQQPDARRLADAEQRVVLARRPAPRRDPIHVERDLCNALCNLATIRLGLAQTAEALQAAEQARAILRQNWPTSRSWRRGSQFVWEALSYLDAQAAFEREDVGALERILRERAELWRLIVADMRQNGSRPIEITFKVRDVRNAHRQAAETVLLLTGDLARARAAWQPVRGYLGPTEKPSAYMDPAWFAP